ncbi:hypothetical protein TIFTF001_007351 [Ficus carica]|uniref:rRNA-processing protein FYV7 n=1 Tax=Ficus carica TaxID=3494 RepID=A0AA87ZL54_FICCA|nr:hypothetical protein TIFTF001_007351 [Ficus carica]
MKNRPPKDEANGAPKSLNIKRRNNKTRGLSLEAFANAKSNSHYYNPALIKKQKELYKNAKYVSKFKKSIKQYGQQRNLSSAIKPQEDDNETERNRETNNKNRKGKNKCKFSLKEIYEKKREEEEKARMEREAIIQAKKEKRENAQARRKATREKMLKKTRKGQPVMKYRIEHLLETIQGLKSNK